MHIDLQTLTALFPQLVTSLPNFIGIILPVIIELLSRDIPVGKQLTLKFWKFDYSIDERYAASTVICFLVAILLKWNDLTTGNPIDLLTYFAVIYTEAHVVFKTYFQGSFIQEKIQKDPPKEYNYPELPQAAG